jgi:hypothetical protein
MSNLIWANFIFHEAIDDPVVNLCVHNYRCVKQDFTRKRKKDVETGYSTDQNACHSTERTHARVTTLLAPNVMFCACARVQNTVSCACARVLR